MWQSCVEIEDYFVVYFDRITTFKALYCWSSTKGEAHTRFVDASDIHVSMKLAWAPPLAEVQQYGTLNAAKCPKYTAE